MNSLDPRDCVPHAFRCAGKKLHEALFSDALPDTLKRMFLSECCCHANLRHPHIVQLLGVYTQPGGVLPMLVMEFMHCTLRACLEKYPDMPVQYKRRILYDVALGLRFLHERPDPIIHRDLTANNVLLTEDFRAKISDLGVAKILPYNTRKMTMTPGTHDYMPPEALVSEPVYDTKLDMFSFGILILHVVTQEWPSAHLSHSYKNSSGQLMARSEAARRANFFEKMDSNDVLKFLAEKCVQNDPETRPAAREVANELHAVVVAPSARLTLALEKKAAEEQRDALLQLHQSVEAQLHHIVQDMSCKFTLNEPELDGVTKELKAVVRSTRSALYGSENSRCDFAQRRFIVAYQRPGALSSAESDECVALNVSSTSPILSVTVHAPVNITFSGTYVKTVISGLTRSFGVAVSGDKLCVVDKKGWYGVHTCSISGEGPETKPFALSSCKVDVITGMPLEKCWQPGGIAIDSEKNVVFVDTESHRVVKFSPDGEFLASTGKLLESGSELGQFNKPVGVTLASNGDLYVCDRGNHRVQILNSNLLSMRAFGELGSGPSQFQNPWDVAFDSKGNVYVVDCSNFCIEVFTKDFGKFVRSIGQQGIGNGDFQAPSSICIDSNDNIYVTDRKLCCVKIFSPDGKFVMKFGGSRHERPEYCFQKPCGIAVDDKGRLFVSDSENGRVLMFE